MKKKTVATKIFFAITLVSIVILGFKVTDQQNQLDEYQSNAAQVSILLTGDERVAGYTCGLLSIRDAEDILGAEVKRSFQQGPSDKVREEKPAQELLFWSDSCRYEDSINNSKYAELYLTTFQSDDAAKEAFPDFIQSVNDAKELPAEPYGEALVYDGGVYYLLRDNQVIQVSASNGSPQSSESFSREVFTKIVKN